VNVDFPVVVDVESGGVRVIRNRPNFDVCDVNDGVIVGVARSTTSVPSIVVAKYKPGAEDLVHSWFIFYFLLRVTR
jgi:hypothetical protein